MKTTIAMLTLCGLFIGGTAWGHPCPEGEGTAVNRTASIPADGSSDYEALRPKYSTFEEADRSKRDKRGRHAYMNSSYHAVKAEYMLWEILKEVRSKGICKPSPEGEGAAVNRTASSPADRSSDYEALRPKYSTFEEADRSKRDKRGRHAYINSSYHAVKAEYMLWEILKNVRSEGFCK